MSNQTATNLQSIEMPIWVVQEYLGDDDEGNVIVWESQPWCLDMGNDDDGNPVLVEVP